MSCGSCGGSRTKPTVNSYELTKPSGEVTIFSTLVEARTQRSIAGGGTIRTIQTPATA